MEGGVRVLFAMAGGFELNRDVRIVAKRGIGTLEEAVDITIRQVTHTVGRFETEAVMNRS